MSGVANLDPLIIFQIKDCSAFSHWTSVDALSWFSKSILMELATVLWPLKSHSFQWLPGPQPGPDQIHLYSRSFLYIKVWYWKFTLLHILKICCIYGNVDILVMILIMTYLCSLYIKLWAMHSEMLKHGKSLGTIGIYNTYTIIHTGKEIEFQVLTTCMKWCDEWKLLRCWEYMAFPKLLCCSFCIFFLLRAACRGWKDHFRAYPGTVWWPPCQDSSPRRHHLLRPRLLWRWRLYHRLCWTLCHPAHPHRQCCCWCLAGKDSLLRSKFKEYLRHLERFLLAESRLPGWVKMWQITAGGARYGCEKCAC